MRSEGDCYHGLLCRPRLSPNHILTCPAASNAGPTSIRSAATHESEPHVRSPHRQTQSLLLFGVSQTPSQLLVTNQTGSALPTPLQGGEHCFQKGCCSIKLVQYCHLVFCAFPAPHTRVLTVHTCNRHADMHTSRLLLNRQAGSQHWGSLGVSVFAFLVPSPATVLLSSLWDLYPQILAGRHAGLPDTTRAPVQCGFKISNERDFSASVSQWCLPERVHRWSEIQS